MAAKDPLPENCRPLIYLPTDELPEIYEEARDGVKMLSVIGAGFGRTGTNSLQVTLEKLGYHRCYHMYEVDANPGHAAEWSKAADARRPQSGR